MVQISNWKVCEINSFCVHAFVSLDEETYANYHEYFMIIGLLLKGFWQTDSLLFFFFNL